MVCVGERDGDWDGRRLILSSPAVNPSGTGTENSDRARIDPHISVRSHSLRSDHLGSAVERQGKENDVASDRERYAGPEHRVALLARSAQYPPPQTLPPARLPFGPVSAQSSWMSSDEDKPAEFLGPVLLDRPTKASSRAAATIPNQETEQRQIPDERRGRQDGGGEKFSQNSSESGSSRTLDDGHHVDDEAEEQCGDLCARVSALQGWLRKLPLSLPSVVVTSGVAVHEFARAWMDGVALCDLVGCLECINGGLQGVERKPKAPASRKHNMCKALELLRRKRTMPSTHLFADDELLRGACVVTISLLEQIRKAYGNVHTSVPARGVQSVGGGSARPEHYPLGPRIHAGTRSRSATPGSD